MQTAEELLKQAQLLNKEKDHAKVIELLTEDLLGLFQNSDLYAEKAEALWGLGEYELCENAINKSLSINPENAKSNNYKGSVSYDQKKYDLAKKHFTLAIKSNPTMKKAYHGLGNTYRKLKDFNKAIESYNEAIIIDPTFPNPYNGLGNLYRQLKDTEKAISFYDKAIKADPQYYASYFNRAIAYELQGNYKKALADYKKRYEFTKSNSDYYTLLSKSKIISLKKIIKKPDYKSISVIIESIKKILLYEDKCVTHYTSFTVSQALILKNSKFRLSEGTYLNDTSEGRELFNFLPGLNSVTIKANDTIALQFLPKPFIGSFVAEKKHDDLTLWRMYGKEDKEEARGCAITMDRTELLATLKSSLIPTETIGDSEKIDEEFNFFRVAYRSNDSKTQFIIPGATNKERELNLLMDQLYYKVDAFIKKEREKTKKTH